MGLKIITPPIREPITIEEVKMHNRIDTNDDNFNLDSYIKTAVERCEMISKRRMVTQTWEYILNDFPCTDYIEIPYPQLQSIVSIKYKDSNGTETTLSEGTDYLVDNDSEPGKVFLPYNKSWPCFTPYPQNAVRVRYVCGYENIDDIPYMLKSGMWLHVGLLYRYRDSSIPESDMKAVDTLYKSAKVYGWC